MSGTRPSFCVLSSKFAEIYGDGTVRNVGNKIGGKVAQNIQIGIDDPDPRAGFKNACAIRMSFSLNYAGTPITRGPWGTVSGKDGKQYIYRVSDLLRFLKQRFGAPDKTVKNPKPSDLASDKGILVFSVSGWIDASGHATLWNGATCSDHCYFQNASEASIWLLK